TRPRRPPILRPPDRPVGRRGAQQSRRPLLSEGPRRGCDRGVHARARAGPEDAGRAAQPRNCLSRYRLLRSARGAAAGAAAPGALERAVELNPDKANAHYLMAFVLGDLGRHQDARVASKRAIQLNPPLARAQTNLSLERYTAERKSQERRQRLAPEPQVVEGNELAHYNLGLAFRQKGYYNEALKEYRLALERGEDRRLTLQAM